LQGFAGDKGESGGLKSGNHEYLEKVNQIGVGGRAGGGQVWV